ncbi:hypothetical protein [Acrocarpospora sp. B8E8]
MPDPQDPLSALAAAAAQLHELFTTYVAAGFTETQALYLVGQMVAASMKP